MTGFHSWHADDEVILWGVNVLMQVTIVSMIALFAARFGRWNAATRYRLFLGCLFLVLFSPAFALLMKEYGLGYFSVSVLQEQPVSEINDTLIDDVQASLGVLSVAPPFPQMDDEPNVRETSNAVVRPVDSATTRQSKHERPTSTFAWGSVFRITVNSILALWLVGAVLYLLRMFRGLWKLLSILRNARPLDIECLDDVVDEVCRASRTSRMPRLVSSPNVPSPATTAPTPAPIRSRRSTWVKRGLCAGMPE